MNSLAPHPLLTEPHKARETLERRLKDDRLAARQRVRRLGETLIAMGLITRREAEKVARLQIKTNKPFGRIALEQRFVKPDDIQAAIGVQFGMLRALPGDGNQVPKIPEGLVVLRQPHADVAEQMRLIRTRLITSCNPADLKAISMIDFGTSTATLSLACNLAAAFAQLHRRVLIIDCNLRQPSLHHFFDMGRDRGLMEYLTGRARFDDVTVPSLVTRLDLLTAGHRAYNPQILLGSDSFDSLLKRARRDYDVVFLLSSGFGPAADGQFVWQKSDSALIVPHKHKTREPDLKQLSAVLYDLDTKILGAVLAQ
ncbi:MAG: hypothetical protein AAFY83_06215 [Pseudomonadota bacterium]